MAVHYFYRTPLDNYEPVPRAYLAGHLEYYAADAEDNRSGRECWKIVEPSSQLKDARRAIYILDDGTDVFPVYVAGWSGPTAVGTPYILLHRLPVNGGTRPDNGRPVDMSGWALGPRRAYHFKLTPANLGN